jgi:hypothetical protein
MFKTSRLRCFPLTPALSRGERENGRPAHDNMGFTVID